MNTKIKSLFFFACFLCFYACKNLEKNLNSSDFSNISPPPHYDSTGEFFIVTEKDKRFLVPISDMHDGTYQRKKEERERQKR